MSSQVHVVIVHHKHTYVNFSHERVDFGKKTEWVPIVLKQFSKM